MKAYVFINKSMPLNLGHVGWGFETSPGKFCFGAKEAVGTILIPVGQDNNVFVAYGSETTMLSTMKRTVNNFVYHNYKVVEVSDTDPDAATALAEDSKTWGYFIGTNNCMDDVFKIIKCYARNDNNILPWPSTNWTPNGFFNAIKSTEQSL
jgi:hypothetical protein